MAGVRTYSAGDVVLTVGGAIISGFADGTFVTVAREAASFTKVTGSDGTVSRARSNNRSGTMTITLLQTSPSNDILSAFLAEDELNGTGVFQVLLKDVTGGSRFFSAVAWVETLPSVEYGKELSNREWTLALSDIEFNVTGNVAIGG